MKDVWFCFLSLGNTKAVMVRAFSEILYFRDVAFPLNFYDALLPFFYGGNKNIASSGRRKRYYIQFLKNFLHFHDSCDMVKVPFQGDSTGKKGHKFNKIHYVYIVGSEGVNMETTTMTREMRVVHVESETHSLPKSSYHYLDRRGYDFFKRVSDVLIAVLAAMLLTPVFFILALCVKLSSKGPVFFKDIRMGKAGKSIRVYKFRSMYIDAETHPEKYLTPEQYRRWKEERKLDDDPRITGIGKFLRKTSLDELPQLFNIINGTMSIVGPRAITAQELDTHYEEEEKRILLSVRPGLTGFWQAYGRSNITFESGKRQEMDLYYVYNRSMLFDLKLICHTVPAVLHSDGAK